MMNNIDDSIVEKVWQDLNEQLPREQVRRVVAEIALGFQDATVKAFVPILIHRQSVERLKSNLNENVLSANGRILFADDQQQGYGPAAKSQINDKTKGTTKMKN